MKREFRFIFINNEKTIYAINKDGIVMNTTSGKFLKWRPAGTGYVHVDLKHNNKNYPMYIHRLVALVYVPNDDPQNKNEVNHKDGNKLNNNYKNLEWCTSKHNKQHALINHLKETYITIEQVNLICKYLEENKLTVQEIADILNISKYIIASIKQKASWANISENYKIPKVKKNKVNYKPYFTIIDDLLLKGYKPKEIIDKIKIHGSDRSTYKTVIYRRTIKLKEKNLL